jgi:hypothetical protein
MRCGLHGGRAVSPGRTAGSGLADSMIAYGVASTRQSLLYLPEFAAEHAEEWAGELDAPGRAPFPGVAGASTPTLSSLRAVACAIAMIR